MKAEKVTVASVLASIEMLETITNEEFSLLVEHLKTKKPISNYKKGENIGVGAFIKERLLEGKSNKDILAEVHEHYGNTNTTYACVAWYKNDLKKKGKL